jgi:hypothetical protein
MEFPKPSLPVISGIPRRSIPETTKKLEHRVLINFKNTKKIFSEQFPTIEGTISSKYFEDIMCRKINKRPKILEK